MNRPVNLFAKLGTFSDHWAPRTIGGLNGFDLMVVKIKGEFAWHRHEDTDDFFLVLHGRLIVRMPARDNSKMEKNS